MALSCAGCGAAYDLEEVNRVIFQDTGVIAGYDFGMKWDDIKAKHDEVFEVRDDEFKQLRRKSLFHNAGDNGYFIGFGFDKAGGVDQFDVTVSGANSATLATVAKVHDQLLAKYEGEYGPGDCTGSTKDTTSMTCTWSGETRVKLSMHKLADSDRGGVDLLISANPE